MADIVEELFTRQVTDLIKSSGLRYARDCVKKLVIDFLRQRVLGILEYFDGQKSLRWHLSHQTGYVLCILQPYEILGDGTRTNFDHLGRYKGFYVAVPEIMAYIRMGLPRDPNFRVVEFTDEDVDVDEDEEDHLFSQQSSIHNRQTLGAGVSGAPSTSKYKSSWYSRIFSEAGVSGAPSTSKYIPRYHSEKVDQTMREVISLSVAPKGSPYLSENREVTNASLPCLVDSPPSSPEVPSNVPTAASSKKEDKSPKSKTVNPKKSLKKPKKSSKIVASELLKAKLVEPPPISTSPAPVSPASNVLVSTSSKKGEKYFKSKTSRNIIKKDLKNPRRSSRIAAKKLRETQHLKDKKTKLVKLPPISASPAPNVLASTSSKNEVSRDAADAVLDAGALNAVPLDALDGICYDDLTKVSIDDLIAVIDSHEAVSSDPVSPDPVSPDPVSLIKAFLLQSVPM